MTFADLNEAAQAVNRINDDYERHRRAARRIAENIFPSDRVLPALLDMAMS